MAPSSRDRDVTALLRACARGDRAALDELLPLVYGELRRQAARCLRAQPAGHALQPTALVHEAYLRLVDRGGTGADWQDRSHFFAVAARVMRSLLVDYARARRTAKRRGGAHALTLDGADAAVAAGATYVTLLSGTNDVCESSVAAMTSVANFTTQARTTAPDGSLAQPAAGSCRP